MGVPNAGDSNSSLVPIVASVDGNPALLEMMGDCFQKSGLPISPSSRAGYFRLWRMADLAVLALLVCCGGQSRRSLVTFTSSQFDPEQSFVALHSPRCSERHRGRKNIVHAFNFTAKRVTIRSAKG